MIEEINIMLNTSSIDSEFIKNEQNTHYKMSGGFHILLLLTNKQNNHKFMIVLT